MNRLVKTGKLESTWVDTRRQRLWETRQRLGANVIRSFDDHPDVNLKSGRIVVSGAAAALTVLEDGAGDFVALYDEPIPPKTATFENPCGRR